MLETPHGLVGMVIAAIVPNPLIGLPLAFLSHFVVDMLPHWNWEPDARPLSLTGIILDLILLEIFVVRFAFQSPLQLNIAAAAFFAILPDLLEAPYIFLGFNNRYLKKLCDFQKGIQNKVPPIPGILTQLLLSAICLLVLTR
jgi:hypothetical protein